MADFAPVGPKAVTDCRKCGFLCLGPTLMACGHVICRKCLQETLVQNGRNARCPFCNFPALLPELDPDEESSEDPAALLDRFEQDAILENLVSCFTTECGNCKSEKASIACKDCQQYFCFTCHLQHAEKEEFQSHESQTLPSASTLASSSLAPSSPASEQETCMDTDQEQQDVCSTSDAQTNSSQATELRQEGYELMGLNRSLSDAARSIENLQMEVEDYRRSILHSINVLCDELLRVQEAQERQDQQTRSTVESLQNQQRLMEAYASRLRSPWAAMLTSPRRLDVRLKRLKTDCREMQIEANAKRKQLEKRKELAIEMQSAIYDMLEPVEREAKNNPDLNTCVPKPLLKVVPCASEDSEKHSCQISSIAITADGRLVMADCVNYSVKIWFPSAPSNVASVRLCGKPLRLCVLDDNQIAVTGERNVLFVVDVDLKTFSKAPTEEQYCGIGATGDMLVVTCRYIAHRVDLVGRDGAILRKVDIQGDSLHHVHVTRAGHVLLSSHIGHCVHRVDLSTGGLLETLTSPDLQQPYQAAEDAQGNVYVASWGHRCLLVRLAKDATWRRLLDHDLLSDGYDRPAGVVVIGSRLVVTWDKFSPSPQSSLIACYDLI